MTEDASTRTLDLFRLGCVAVGIIGVFTLAEGFLWGAITGVQWNTAILGDETRHEHGLTGLLARTVLLGAAAALPGVLLIVYRKEVTRRWLLADDAVAVETTRVRVGRLAFALLGIWTIIGGAQSLAQIPARVLLPKAPDVEPGEWLLYLLYGLAAILAGVVVVAGARVFGVHLGGDEPDL